MELQPEKAMRPNQEWNILFVDDEAGIRDVARLYLEDAGYRVETAPNGLEALKLCESNPPQIIITDIRMPGMDGIELLEAVKKRYPDVEVVVATAFGDMEVAVRALQRDASDFIAKPLDKEALDVALSRAKQRFTDRRNLCVYTEFLERDWSETTEELMEAIEFQNRLIDSSMDGIIGCNAEGRVVTFNAGMEQLTGFRKSEVIHRKPFGTFFLPEEEERMRRALADDRYGGEDRLFKFETTLKSREGGRIPIQLSASVIREKGVESGLVCFCRDLREIHRLEREMEDQSRVLHQDKMMSLGRLAASVVHEINNPLAGILNYCRLMIRILGRGELKAENRDKFIAYLDLIEKESARCSEIVSSLLTFSRKSSPAFGAVSLDDLLDRSILLTQHKLELSRIRLETRIAPELPDIQGDANQLQQCIINLIFNAIDAMPKGGTIFLTATHEAADRAVLLEIRDTGAGISEAHLPHIFEPFYTTKDEGYGVGLGLSTVYGIVESHHGHIEVESRPGEGTRFLLRFPVDNGRSTAGARNERRPIWERKS
ncbi:MAG: response regulator [Desulfobacterales bacterium]